MQEDEIAVDIEGINLCRDGKICLIQICGRTSPENVYLFDISKLGKSAFMEGRLKELFEDQNIQKIVYDGRGDNDALYHLYQVLMCNVYDLQVLFVQKFSNSNDRFLKGLGTALQKFGLSTKDIEAKRVGYALFDPKQGGCYK